MSDGADPEQRKSKLRWVTLGEAIAVAALVVSAFGVWISWKDSGEEKAPATTSIVERQAAIPLVLRGRIQNEGRTLEIAPVESSHSLQSLTLRVPSSGSEIRIGGDTETDSATTGTTSVENGNQTALILHRPGTACLRCHRDIS